MGISAGLGAAIGGIGSGVLGAGASLIGSSKSSAAAKNAADVQKQMFQTTQGNLQPFTSAGAGVLPQLTSLATGSPTGGGPDYVSMAQGNLPPALMTQSALEQTPGYQFTLGQGLKSTLSANAARGLGVSGAALKGAASYATGLANSTFMTDWQTAQQNFQNILNLNTAQQSNLSNQYSRLSGIASLGENAGAMTGNTGATLAGNQGNYLSQAGQLSGAGAIGASNAVSGAGQNYLGYAALQQMINPATSSSGGTGGYNDTSSPAWDLSNYGAPGTPANP